MIKYFHDDPDDKHFLARTTSMKIMRVGYYWPTLFNDYHKHVRKCEKCAFFSSKQRLKSIHLHPIQVDKLFAQCRLYLISQINSPSSSCHKWILATKGYFTRWIEVVAFKDVTNTLVEKFLSGIVTRFGVPSTIISDNAKSFVGTQICS